MIIISLNKKKMKKKNLLAVLHVAVLFVLYKSATSPNISPGPIAPTGVSTKRFSV